MNRANQQKSIASIFSEIKETGGLIPIFPAGKTDGRDGRGPYFLKDADKVIEASSSELVDIAIDREHAMDVMPKGTPVPAAGWIKELLNVDGAIFARVEWTPTAQAELASKEFRYISPTFYHTKNGLEVARIIGATLTNRPNFEMKAIASAEDSDDQISQTKNQQETTEMNKLLLALAALLGLPDTAKEDAILTTASEKIAQMAVLEKDMASFKAALKVDEKADSAKVIETATQLATASEQTSEKVDLTKYVPMEMFQATASQLSKLTKSTASEKVTAAVDEAIKAGKIPPAQKDWALATASQDLETFNKFVESMPVLASADTEINLSADKKSDGELDTEEKAICSQLGLSEDEYKATRPAKS